MNIELRCFATLNTFAPKTPEAYSVPDDATVADVMATLGIPPAEVKIIFVNGIKREPETRLNTGDRVGLFPAVGGG